MRFALVFLCDGLCLARFRGKQWQSSGAGGHSALLPTSKRAQEWWRQLGRDAGRLVDVG